MKKLIVLSLAALFCLPLSSYAASIGGTETQGQGKLAIGLDQEILFDRDMKVKSMEPNSGAENNVNIDNEYRTVVKASYGVLDNLDIYVKLGTADFETKNNWSDPADTGTIKNKTKNAFAYGMGIKGTYSLKNDWLIGADLQYLTHKNKYKGSLINETSPASSEDFSGKMNVQEWQAAPYIAKKIENFVPYIGVKYSDLRIEDKFTLSVGDIKSKMKASDNVGVFLGTDYKLGKNWKLNMEGRFIDETAMSFGATYKL